MLPAKLLETFAELLDDAGRMSKLWPALSIGAVLGVLVIIFQISFAAIVFSGPMAPLAIHGIGLLLFGALVTVVITALTSNYKGIISFPMEVTISVVAIIGAGVAVSIEGPVGQRHLATMAVIMGATSLITAAAFLLMGRFHLTNYLRFIPFPVAAGILAATGWGETFQGHVHLRADYTNCSGLGWVTDWMTVNQAYSAVVIDADTGTDADGM